MRVCGRMTLKKWGVADSKEEAMEDFRYEEVFSSFLGSLMFKLSLTYQMGRWVIIQIVVELN